MAPGGTPDATILLPPVNANPPVTLTMNVSLAPPRAELYHGCGTNFLAQPGLIS
jgi:hypothetical protein